MLWSDASPPVPSPADAGYLLLPPLVFAGLIVLARSSGPYDQGWWAIAVCFAAAAWTEPRRRAAEVRQRAMISVPIAFGVVSLTILVAGTLTKVSLPAVLLASAAIVSVLLRLALTFRAHQEMLQTLAARLRPIP